MRRALLATSLSFLSLIALMALACGPQAPVGDSAPDLFALAVEGAPGGALLAVWGDPAEQRAWLVGGYVGVDPARIPDGRVGRLVEYSNGSFVTRCTTDQVLWWVHGARESGRTTVWAVGEGQKLVRFRDGRCEDIPLGLNFEDGPPTFWGLVVRSPEDLWMVGGSARPTGPRGVIVHGDGRSFTRVFTLPLEAREQNLYKITQSGSSLWVVGAGNTMLRGDSSGVFSNDPLPPRGGDNRLFTVSCLGSLCFSVGGSGSGFALARGVHGAPPGVWNNLLQELPGLNGVWVQDNANVWIVGADGLTLHTDGSRVFRAPRALTQSTLHGVGGIGGRAVLAVGGELSVNDPSQRAVVLVRDLSRDPLLPYTFDGQTFSARGELRRTLGAAGQ